MKRINIKELFIQLRNGLAFTFSWLVVCIMVVLAVYGKDTVSVGILFKLLALSFWAVSCFIICFGDVVIRKKGFIFRLSLFYLTFIPAEVVLFFLMKIFTTDGTALEWTVFAVLIAGLYVICLLIDWIVCRKQGKEYTARLLAYNERRAYEQRNRNTGAGYSSQN